VLLPLTLSVALLALGFTGFDSPPRGGAPGPPPRAVSSKRTRFISPERLLSPACPALLACANHRPARRRLCDRFDPRAQPWIVAEPGLHAESIQGLALPVNITSSMAFLADAMQAEARWVRTRSAFAAQEPSRTTTGEGRRSGRALPRSISLEHLLSRARGNAGWRDQRLRMLAHRFRTRRGPFGHPAKPGYPPCPVRTASRLPPRRGGRSAAPKVPSVPENSPRGATPTRQAVQGSSQPGGLDLCPQVVLSLWKRGPRLFHPASCPALTE